MSDEGDNANDTMMQMTELAISAALRQSAQRVKAEPEECFHCEENVRPWIVGKSGHLHRAANCARCMTELGMEFVLAENPNAAMA